MTTWRRRRPARGARRPHPYTWGRCVVSVVLLALFGLGGAPSEGGEGGRLPGDESADALVAAFDRGDLATLRGIAEAAGTDPWRAADALVHRGRADVAEAFAREAPAHEFAPLRAYVLARRRFPPDAARRKTWQAAITAHAQKDWKALLAESADVSADATDVPSLSIQLLRTIALGELGRREQELRELDSLATRLEALGWARLACRTRFVAGTRRQELGDGQGALESYARSRNAADATLRVDLQVSARATLAILHLERAELALALGVGEEALERARRAQLSDWVESLAPVLTGVLQGLGEPARAIPILREAIDGHLARGDAVGAAPLHLLLGTVLLAVGKLHEAVEAFETSRSTFDRAGRRTDEAQAGLALVLASTALADMESASRWLARYGGARSAEGPPDEGIRAVHVAALLDAKAGRWPGVAQKLRRVHAHFLAQSLPFEAARIAPTLARAELEVGELEAARGHLEVALPLLALPADAANRTFARILLAVVRVRRGDVEAGLAAAELGLVEAERSGVPALLVLAAGQAAGLYAHAGQYERAVALARRAADESSLLLRAGGDQESSISLQGLTPDFLAVGARSSWRLGDPAGVCWFLESSRAGALRDALGVREAVWNASIPEGLRQAEETARAEEAEASARWRSAFLGGQFAAIRARGTELDAARSRVREVVARIQREAVAAADVVYPKVAELGTIQGLLADGDAFVSYLVAPDETEALALVARKGAARVVSLGPSRPLAEAARSLDAGRRDADPEPSLRWLREHLVEPLGLDASVRRVLVCPDGPLNYVPFALLAPEQDVVFLPSGSVMRTLFLDRGMKGVGVLALGDPAFGTGSGEAAPRRGRGPSGGILSPLPGTRAEALAVGDVVLLGAEAGERRLRQALAGRPRWHGVHLGTHGLVYPADPMLSALALATEEGSDGLLSVADVFGMRIPSDLTVLSACETARGQLVAGEGVHGLTRAFMLAGSPRVLVSLWKVDDEATHALMTKFYALWNPKDGSTGLGAAAALRAAQAYVRSDAKWRRPYYWAAWVLWGLPD